MQNQESFDFELKQNIRKILNENSGGIKFMTLIPHLIKMAGEIDIEYIKRILEEMQPEIAILHYTWKTHNREKLFIYTP